MFVSLLFDEFVDKAHSFRSRYAAQKVDDQKDQCLMRGFVAQTQHVSPHDKPFDRITQHLNREIKIDIRLKEALLDPLQQRESELSEAVSATMFRRDPL